MHDELKKGKLISRFDDSAKDRQAWMARNRYYYEDQKRYLRFLVPERLSVFELGCGTGDLLNA